MTYMVPLTPDLANRISMRLREDMDITSREMLAELTEAIAIAGEHVHHVDMLASDLLATLETATGRKMPAKLDARGLLAAKTAIIALVTADAVPAPATVVERAANDGGGSVTMVPTVAGENRAREPVDVHEAWLPGDRVELDGEWYLVHPGRRWRGPACLVTLVREPEQHEGQF